MLQKTENIGLLTFSNKENKILFIETRNRQIEIEKSIKYFLKR